MDRESACAHDEVCFLRDHWKKEKEIVRFLYFVTMADVIQAFITPLLNGRKFSVIFGQRKLA